MKLTEFKVSLQQKREQRVDTRSVIYQNKESPVLTATKLSDSLTMIVRLSVLQLFTCLTLLVPLIYLCLVTVAYLLASSVSLLSDNSWLQPFCTYGRSYRCLHPYRPSLGITATIPIPTCPGLPPYLSIVVACWPLIGPFFFVLWRLR